MSRTEAQKLFLRGAEVHSAETIAAALEMGLAPDETIDGHSPVDWLVERMYLRSDRFVACLETLINAGARLEDPFLAAVLLDDGEGVRATLAKKPARLATRYDLACSFTPLEGATPLHVAAEFGALRAARVLIDAGADIDAPAAVDGEGLNGHTPVFHTVHAHDNFGQPMLRLLLAAGAATDVRLAGIVWGRGFEWETVLLDQSLVTYTQCGLLPQFQRREEDVYTNLRLIYGVAGRAMPGLRNVPNRYLDRG